MSRASIGILGPLEVHVDGGRVEVGAMQLRRLLCVLLLAPGRPVPTSTVLECLWPDDEQPAARPENASKTLRIYASRLRKLFPQEIGPHSDVRGYRLDLTADDLDAGRFEARFDAAQRDKSGGPARTAELLASALGLWRGPALSDCRDELWAVGAAARLDELRIAATEQLIDARLAVGEHAELCAELEHLVTEHPLRERFWAQLMVALYRAGRQADALRAFQRLRAHLGEELGIEPSRELADLEGAMLRQDPALDLVVGDVGTVIGLDGDRPSEPAPTVGSADLARHDAPEETAARAGGLPEPGIPGRLPVRSTSFVGRGRELEELTEVMQRSRLVTLTGPGGVGKTRLALEASRRLALEPASDPLFFVDMASLRDGDGLLSRLALVLGIRVPPGADVPAAIAKAIGDEHLQLLLDNCEHLASECASICSTLLQNCRGARVLATSTRSLAVEGEALYLVPPLGVPARDGAGALEAAGEDAVRLFVERASAVRPGFDVTTSNASDVVTICRRLDGIPLALELAAARLKVLSTAQICDGLDARFALLGVAVGPNLSRHKTLEALISWSYELLAPDERRLLRRVSVFSGGFDIDAARALGENEGSDLWSILNGIAALVDMSLVHADTSGDVARYGLLESIRQYALARLTAEEGDESLETLRDAHAAVYVGIALRTGAALHARGGFVAAERLEADYANLRAALDHLLTDGRGLRDAMRVFTALARFCHWYWHSGDWSVIGDALVACLEADDLDPLALRVRLLSAQLIGQTDPVRAARLLEEIVERAAALGDDAIGAMALKRLCWNLRATGAEGSRTRELQAQALALARRSGDYEALSYVLEEGDEEQLAEAFELIRARGDEIGECYVLGSLSNLALVAGDFAAAEEHARRAVAIVAEGGSAVGMDLSLIVNLAFALARRGKRGEARTLYRGAVETSRRQPDERDLGYALIGLGLCASGDGDLVLAATLFGACRERFESRGFTLDSAPAEAAALSEEEARVRTRLGRAGYKAAVERGRRLSKDEAADLALGRLGPMLMRRPHRASSPDGRSR